MNVTIIVLYKPSVEVIDNIRNFSSTKNRIIAVVNEASDNIIQILCSLKNVDVIKNSENLGLATALNQGLNFALNIDAEYILLLDQDSKPNFGMEFELRKKIKKIPHCLISPTLVDIKHETKTINLSDDLVEVEGMATSGTFMSSETARLIGPVRDELFIDGIDHEWCFRAKSLGIKLLQTKKTTMLHNMGDRGISYLGKHKPIHDNPIRHYYIIRNYFYLARLGYVPFRWKIIEFLKTLRRIPVYIITSKDKKKTSVMIIKGIYHGIIKKWGKGV